MNLLSFKHVITETFTPKSIHNTLLGILLLFKIRSSEIFIFKANNNLLFLY